MKNSAKRFWPLIPLIIWILIFPIVGGVLAWATGFKNLGLLALIDIITIFELVWYLMTCTRNNETGIINKVANWLVLDFPAVFMINHWFRIKKVADAKINEKDSAYVKQIQDEDADQKDEEEWDVNLADWEKEILKKKNPEKYGQYVKQEQRENIVDYKIQEERKIIRGFSVYIMYQIYLKDSDIVNTYNIINMYKDMVQDNVEKDKLIKSFSKTKDLATFIEDYDAKAMTSALITNVLTKTEPQEFIVAFNQDRVQIMIDAKDNLFERNKTKAIGSKKKAIGSKSSTKKTSTKSKTPSKKSIE